MEDSDSRRTRKPVNYAEFADVSLGDDDFDDDFKISSSKSKQEKQAEKGNREDKKDDGERKRSRDKHKEHKKHKDKDRERHKKDKDRHRERHKREDGEKKDDHRSRHERKRKEHDKERRHRSERRDDESIDNSGRSTGSSDSKYDSADSQRSSDSPALTSTTASPLVSPGRRNPKPRLSLEEKMFQRELEAALELSKNSSPTQGSTSAPEVKELTEEEGTPSDVQALVSPKSPQKDSAEGGCPMPPQDHEIIDKGSSSATDEGGAPECVKEKDELPDPPAARATQKPPLSTVQCSDLMEPQPSTSTGLGLKRARKTVNFKEDSDSSDGFDGFSYNSGESDASEGSDFMPSPKKKKKQKSKDSKKTTKAAQQTKTNVGKSSAKTPAKNRPTRQVSSPPTRSQAAKENTAPRSPIHPPPPPARSTVASPITSTVTQPKVPPVSPKAPPVKASTTKNTTSVAKPVKRPVTNTTTPSSPASGTASIALVKTPFRSPLTTSPGSGYPNNSSPSSAGARQRGTGLRLGLSRRAIIKPLHPSVAAKITD